MPLTLRLRRAIPSALALVLLCACTLGARAYLAGEAAQIQRAGGGAKGAAAVRKGSAAPAAPQAEAAAGTPEAQNALRPFADLPIQPMRPFVLKSGAVDRARAVQCLAQAVYYEAAREPLAGQQAVAQVVLNRVRHPAFPKSVCGVVYEGAVRATGCQFTFTCDGSLRFAPQPALWARAQAVARRALAGYVDADVGSATHYHADYVAPRWAPTMVKMAQVGAHIFYRWNGAWGQPGAFVGRYAGREADLSRAVLASGDPAAGALGGLRKVTLTIDGEARSYAVADASAPGGERTRMAGVLQPAVRSPTLQEVRQINQHLEAMEARLAVPPARAASAGDAAAPTSAVAPMAAMP